MADKTNTPQTDEIRKTLSEDTQAVPPVEPPRNPGANPGAKSTPADSEADNGLERTEESLRDAEEQGRIVRPRKTTDDVPVFERGDLPPKL